MSASEYDKAIDSIRRIVGLLNAELRYNVSDSRNPQVTFGYIGNVERGRDDREWMIFLPHPGRVGTDRDRIGGFTTGDLDGARQTASQAYGALRVLQWRNAR